MSRYFENANRPEVHVPCKLKTIANVFDGSLLEYFCDGDSEAYDAVAEFQCERGDHREVWKHVEIALPAIKRKTLLSACSSYAIDATVSVVSSRETTVNVIARITPPNGTAKEHNVCTVVGKNGTVEFPRLLILMV